MAGGTHHGSELNDNLRGQHGSGTIFGGWRRRRDLGRPAHDAGAGARKQNDKLDGGQRTATPSACSRSAAATISPTSEPLAIRISCGSFAGASSSTYAPPRRPSADA